MSWVRSPLAAPERLIFQLPVSGPAKYAVYAGTSGWAYPTWKPDFYPASTPAKKLLAYYATRLNTVEVNYTFRSLPSASIIKTWLEQTDGAFRFSFKAPQRITHILRLKDCGEALERFGHSIAPVADARRLGLILFQLPPNFKADIEHLDTFLNDAKQIGFRMAFEFRNESWFCPETHSTLRAHSAALCIAESDDLATPEEHTASFSCYRFRKSEYSEADLAAIRSRLQTQAAHGDVFAYFKHEDAPTGALRAASILGGLHAA